MTQVPKITNLDLQMGPLREYKSGVGASWGHKMSLQGHPKFPQGHAKFQHGGSNMVFSPNVQHMAPFWMPPVDSAWFFGAQLWYFRPQGPFLGPQIPDLDPGWAGDLFGQKWDPQKHDFVEKVVPHRDSRGSVRGKWIVWYPGGLWASPFPPKPHQNRIL